MGEWVNYIALRKIKSLKTFFNSNFLQREQYVQRQWFNSASLNLSLNMPAVFEALELGLHVPDV